MNPTKAEHNPNFLKIYQAFSKLTIEISCFFTNFALD